MVVLRGHWVVRRGGAIVYMVGPGLWAMQLVCGQRIVVMGAGSWVGDVGVLWGFFCWWAVVVLRGRWVVSCGGAVVHMVGGLVHGRCSSYVGGETSWWAQGH